MAYGLNDRVREQVSAFAGGTGAVTLPVVAVTGSQTFLSGWGASGTGEYCLAIGAQWETGFGTLNAGGTTLTRTTVYNGSSGSGVAVNFSAGTMDCFGDIPAELAQHLNMREITVASATTCDIGAVAGSSIVISGVTTITGFGTKANRRRYVRFSGAMILTHNGTSLILPGAVNRTTAAGDTAIFASDASGNWRCVSYQPTSGNVIAVKVQKFTATGTYTPSAGLIYAIIEAVGGGGAGGGATSNATNLGGGGGGGGGNYSRKIATAAAIGASQVVTIGAAGAVGSAGNNAGGNGGDTSLGALCIGKGGTGGSGNPGNGTGGGGGGAGGVAGTGDLTIPGGNGAQGLSTASNTTIFPFGGFGGNNPLGMGAAPPATGTAANGNAGGLYGGGGSGGASTANLGAVTGGAGAAGLVVVTEFCNQP